MRIIYSVLLGIGLVGCGISPKYNYHPQTIQVSKPPLGTVSTVSIGDSLLQQGNYTEREALYVSERKRGIGGQFIEKGYYLKTGEDRAGVYYQPTNNIPEGGQIHQPSTALFLDKTGKVCTLMNGGKYCHLKATGEKKTVSVAADNSFQQSLIYSGRVGNKINIGYREYSSNIARPAFNNEVEYDLAESKTIGYKGALLEIISATNQEITYKVLKNFNKE